MGERAEVLAAMGVRDDLLTADERHSLDACGYVVLHDIVAPGAIARILDVVEARLTAARKDPSWTHGGTLHVDDITTESPAVESVWSSPRLLAAVAHLLGDDLHLSRVHYRGPTPGNGAQMMHADASHPKAEEERSRGVTVIVALVDFTEANGATRIIPGSHTRAEWYRLADSVGPRAVKQRKLAPDTRIPRQQTVTCRAGSALVFDVHLFHSGTRNGSDQVRHSLQMSFGVGDPGLMTPAAALSDEAIDRLGDAALLLL